MRPRRADSVDRSHLAPISGGALPERHPRLSLNWADSAARTRTSVRAISGIPVMTVEGALRVATAKPCREAMDAVLRMRPSRMVLDLGGVREADRTTAELLDAMRHFAHWHGVAMSLASVPGCVQSRLDAADVSPPFDIHATADRAVSAALSLPRARRSIVPRDSLGGTE